MKKGIRIDEVLHRTSKVKPALSMYPLYLNYREHYDFQNILECANTWLSYTGDEYKAFKKMLELFDITCKNGSENNVNIIAVKRDNVLDPMPAGDYKFAPNDHIIVIGKSTDVFRLSAKK